jgi:group II intron reverse transcriptase/maturase
MHENREIPAVTDEPMSSARAVKAEQAGDRHARGWEVGRGRSTDEAPKAAAEVAEGRPETEGNAESATTTGTQRPDLVSSGLSRVREAAKRNGKERFTALLHHLTVGMLEDAYWALKPKAAPGVDGVTWSQYGEDLGRNVTDLHARVHAGTYRAQASRRVWIPKADGRQRPLGVAALEDKVVQLAVSWILNAIYEVDFAGFSYGFRPGRGQRNALDSLWVALSERPVNWVLDADIRSFFDTLDHQWLMKFIEHRVADPRILRLIRKWLRAGVCEGGHWSETRVGTPQGAVISPLLANIYLHYVLDLWVKWWRTHEARGEVIMVRYADDFVMGFQFKDDADRFLVKLHERLRQFALDLHPDKTRLIEFGRFAQSNRTRRGGGKAETFNFLGFTHICGKRRSDGGFAVWRHTMTKRLGAKVKEIGQTLMGMRSQPVRQQGTWLRRVVSGWMNYHAIPTNSTAISRFRDLVVEAWHRALRRRSQMAKSLTWARMRALAKAWIAPARVLHPYPNRSQLVRT